MNITPDYKTTLAVIGNLGLTALPLNNELIRFELSAEDLAEDLTSNCIACIAGGILQVRIPVPLVVPRMILPRACELAGAYTFQLRIGGISLDYEGAVFHCFTSTFYEEGGLTAEQVQLCIAASCKIRGEFGRGLLELAREIHSNEDDIFLPN